MRSPVETYLRSHKLRACQGANQYWRALHLSILASIDLAPASQGCIAISMTLLLLFLVLAIGVSFFCSIAEAVLLSVRPSYVTALELKGKSGARTLAKLRENLDRPLAAILTANTIAHTVGAAGVGAQTTVVFGNEYLGVASAILTLLVLVLSEIIPKTLGATYWQVLAPTFGVLILWLTYALYPVVYLSERLTRLLSRTGAKNNVFSREEMQAMAEIGSREGALNKREHKIINNSMKLTRISVRDIMTPRPVVFSVSGKLQVKDFFDAHAEKPFSRIPIHDDTADDISAYVLKTDLLIAQAKDDFDSHLEDFSRKFLVLPDVVTASDAFDRLVQEKSHIALVVDEFGTMQGVVTLEDVLETLIGLEITDELDKVEDMQLLAQKRWRERMIAMGFDPDSVEWNTND